MEDVSSPPKARPQAVREFGQALRRSFDAARTYSAQHNLAREALSRAVRVLMDMLLLHGELELELSGKALTHHDQVVLEAKSRADSVALPLFREGVRRIQFTSELQEAVAVDFFARWIDAWLHPLTSEGIASRLWETQPAGIRAVIIDTFELGMEGGDGDDTGRAATVREQVDAILNAIASEGLAGSSDAKAAAFLSISAEDAALMRSEHVRTVTAQQLASQDVAASALHGLDPHEASTLASQLLEVRESAPLRFVMALVNGALLGTDADRESALATFQRYVIAVGAEGRLVEPYVLYQGLVADVASTVSPTSPRVVLIKRLRELLLSPPVLDALTTGLDGETTAGSAEAAFRVIGKTCVPLLVSRFGLLKTPAGRERAQALLTSYGAGDAVPYFKSSESVMMVDTLLRSPKGSEADRLQVLQRAINSTDVNARRQAVRALTPELVVKLPLVTITNRHCDIDPEVRLAMLDLAVATENPAVVPALVAQLKRPIDGNERGRIYEALSVIGGELALQALLSELQGAHSTEVRIQCAASLGRFVDARARQALQETAAKLLTPPRLRAACKAALAEVSR